VPYCCQSEVIVRAVGQVHRMSGRTIAERGKDA
jgi:hypothetical protein